MANAGMLISSRLRSAILKRRIYIYRERYKWLSVCESPCSLHRWPLTGIAVHLYSGYKLVGWQTCCVW
jgi:hypothetical protein